MKNRSEEFVSELCSKSFLLLWSYPNPRGKEQGKELCDLLVVCDPDVIVISVKESELKGNDSEPISWERWHRKAVEESVRQIYGAERFIKRSPAVVTEAGEKGLDYPDVSRLRIHRVAVALGGEKGVGAIKLGDFGKGFIHTFDETSFRIVISELDTIDDFVTYLANKETLLQSEKRVLFSGDENLLAFYLASNRQFPEGPSLIILDDDLWSNYSQSPDYLAQKAADEDSYIWDWLIESQTKDYQIAGASAYDNTFSPTGEDVSLSSFELALRAMAKENRLCRRFLGQAFKEFASSDSRSRLIGSPTGVQYVFLKGRPSETIELGLKELAARCFIARGLNQQHKIVVGIIEQELIGKGFNINFCYLQQENWTEQDQARFEHLQRELGFFLNPKRATIQVE